MIALNFLWPAALGRSLEAVTHVLLAKKGEKPGPKIGENQIIASENLLGK